MTMYQAVKFPRLNLLFAGHLYGLIRQFSSRRVHIRVSTNKQSLIHPEYNITCGTYGQCEQSVVY